MTPRLLLLRFLAAFGILLLALSFLAERRYDLTYPAALGPKFDARIKVEPVRDIDTIQPDIVLIGDSTLYFGLAPILFSEQLEMPIYKMATPGSGSAALYLQLKNIILEASHRPKYVVIFFRNTLLTTPDYRTRGRYFELVDDYATKNEALVSKLAFINQMSPLEKFAEAYIPIYTARVDIRQDLDDAIRFLPSASLLNCDRGCTNEAVSSIFGREVDPVALNIAQDDAAKSLFNKKALNFEKQLGQSFLPYMIELAQQNGIELVFVRTRIFGPEPDTTEYRKGLDAYLTSQAGVYLLDYWGDPRINPRYYRDSLHMNARGMEEFTKILADDFKRIVLGK